MKVGKNGRLLGCIMVGAMLVGVTLPAVGAERPVAGNRDATPEDLLPDLQVEPLTDFVVQILDGRRVVRFTVSISNRGEGPLELVGTRTSTGTSDMAVVQRIHQRGGGHVPVATEAAMRHADADKHHHWHLQQIAEYSLTVPGEDVPRVAHKEGFCLLDHTQVSGDDERRFTACADGQTESRTVTMGISTGWSDPYSFDVWGQWIDLTGIDLPGRYCVTGSADPLGLLAEADTENNSASALLDLTSDGWTVVSREC